MRTEWKQSTQNCAWYRLSSAHPAGLQVSRVHGRDAEAAAHPRMGCKGYPLHSLGLSYSPFPSVPREKDGPFPVVSQSKAPPTVRSRAGLKLRCQGN